MMPAFDPGQVAVFFQVVLIDLVLSGDNAIVIGIAAASVAPHLRNKVIVYGIIAAVVLRILFALVAVQLLQIVGLTFVGGVVLAYICWKLFNDLRSQDKENEKDKAHAHATAPDGVVPAESGAKAMRTAISRVIIADVSMALDNVLAVAGAAREHPFILAIGLVLSIVLMAVAASLIARLLERYSWLGYVGLAVIVYVAGEMIWTGGIEIIEATSHS